MKTLPDSHRFWSKVDRSAGPDGCWPWTSVIGDTGYGRIAVGPQGGQRHLKAHRVAYMLTVGPIPDGLTLDHLCRNRVCVNPAHLEPVTRGENVLRGVGTSATNARKTHCNNGHPFDAENTKVRVDDRRRCITCDRTYARRARLALAAVATLATLLIAAPIAAAHELTQVEVRCQAKVLHVEGKLFGENLPIVVTVTGEQGYLKTFQVTTDSWRHSFPLPPNGHGQVDWPNSGDFGPVPFTVDCSAPTPRPTPTVVGHTPRPHVVPPPTDTADAEPALSWIDVGVALLLILALTGYVEWRWPELRNRKR